MKPNSAFPEEVSKCILLINFLLPTSCQDCRPMRAPSPVLGSSADTATALDWGHMAAGRASLGRGQLGMSIPAPAPACFPSRRAWSANQSWASFSQRWKSGQAGSQHWGGKQTPNVSSAHHLCSALATARGTDPAISSWNVPLAITISPAENCPFLPILSTSINLSQGF